MMAPSWLTIYAQLARAGFAPEVVYDIGAAHASWSSQIVELFPLATFHLFEPLAEIVPTYREALQTARVKHPHFQVHPVALGASSGTTTIAIAPMPAASTTLDMGEFFPEKRTVPLHSLDDLLHARVLDPPQLLKLDVQGTENRILRGARQVLSSVHVLQVECWLYPGYGPETAMMADIVKMLGDLGFIAIEFSDPYYGDKHQLFAMDLFFLREELADRWVLDPNSD
jgi:FkbM family methyltransferase